MQSFREFIVEGGYHVPVVPLAKDKVDLSLAETRNEINRNFAAELSRQWMTPYGGWRRVGKVLEMYSVFLPKTIFQDIEEGEEVVALNQFGDRWGADLTGKVTSPNAGYDTEYYLYYNYGISEDGFYSCSAAIMTEEDLNSLLDNMDDLDDIDFEGPEGQLDPRQP